MLSDTWNSIGLLQVFDGNISTAHARSDARRYELTWGTDKPKAWLSGNAGIDATYYLPFDTDADVNTFGSLGHSLSWWTTGPHPDWVLYKCDRVTPAWVGGLPTNVPLDISNPAVVAYQMALVGPYMNSAGYNTLSVDVLSITNDPGGCGVWTQNHTKWVQRFSGQVSDPKWVGAVEAWTGYAQWYTHHLTDQIAFVANTSLYAAAGDPNMEAVVSHLDGFMDEAGFTNFGSHMADDHEYQAKIWWARYIQQHGEAFMTVDRWKGAEPTPTQREYAIATYLMQRYHYGVLFTAMAGTYDSEHYWPEYDAAVGAPCGDMYASQGVYFRKNSGSLVVVNTSGSTANVTLPRSASSYTDIEGRPVTNPLAVGSNDGWVLLTSSGCN